MKFLFDENISFRIVEMISDEFPDLNQVRELNLESNQISIYGTIVKRMVLLL